MLVARCAIRLSSPLPQVSLTLQHLAPVLQSIFPGGPGGLAQHDSPAVPGRPKVVHTTAAGILGASANAVLDNRANELICDNPVTVRILGTVIDQKGQLKITLDHIKSLMNDPKLSVNVKKILQKGYFNIPGQTFNVP